MDDSDEFENHVEDSDRSWNRVIATATKAGYREGIEEGKQSVYQQGFDIGYEDAFRTAFLLGKYKGLATALDCNIHHPSVVNDILDKTRRGACRICVQESNKTVPEDDDVLEPPLQEIRNEQKIHSDRVIETLRQHFGKLSQEQSFPVDDLMVE